MITVSNLKKSYGKQEVLKGIDFTVGPGEIYGFLGQNGAGKTTTMNILTGLASFEEGDILIDKQPLKDHQKQILTNIGYLPEDPRFYPYMKGREYLNYIGRISGYPREQIPKRTEELLSLVGLPEAGERKIGGYSRGMRQRLGLGVAVYNHPKILFLDEPSSALDPQGRKELLEIIVKLKDEKTTIFLSTHILSDVERICDRIAILHNGKIQLEEDLHTLQEHYLQPVYEIQWEDNCSALKEPLLAQEWVDKINIDKNYMTLYVNSRKEAQSKLLGVLSGFSLPLVSLGIKRSSLEEIFVKVVNDRD